MPLTGPQYEALVKALAKAYGMNDFGQMLKFRLDKDIDNIVLDGDKTDRIFAVVGEAEMKGWTDDLIRNAHEYSPGSLLLSEFVRKFGYSSARPSDGDAGLERLVNKSSKFQTVAELIGQLSCLEAQICRISYPLGSNKVMYGTGFLVGPDLLLTNNHVIKPVDGGTASPDSVECLFDYRKLSDGTVLGGQKFGLKPEGWLVDHSSHSQADVEINGGVPGLDELDYALVRLADKIGDKPIGSNPNGGQNRGWIDICGTDQSVAVGDVVAVLQHPHGEPQQLAYGTVLKHNSNGTRVCYDTSTKGGSSGSPCFTADFELFALHHAGDPNFEDLHKPEFNQGVPIGRIVAQMKTRQIDICQS